MRSSWRSAVVVAMLAIALVGVGCKKKPPVMPDSGSSPAASSPAPRPAPDVTPAPRPPVVDATPDPLAADIREADGYARGEGLIGDVYFDFDKYDLRQDARDRLAKNADFLRKNPQFQVTIEGHCDERGTNDYNIALGDRRANAAKDYLISLGVAANRVRTVSYGEERPVCTESNESCWWRNRRGEFHLTGKS